MRLSSGRTFLRVISQWYFFDNCVINRPRSLCVPPHADHYYRPQSHHKNHCRKVYFIITSFSGVLFIWTIKKQSESKIKSQTSQGGIHKHLHIIFTQELCRWGRWSGWKSTMRLATQPFWQLGDFQGYARVKNWETCVSTAWGSFRGNNGWDCREEAGPGIQWIKGL